MPMTSEVTMHYGCIALEAVLERSSQAVSGGTVVSAALAIIDQHQEICLLIEQAIAPWGAITAKTLKQLARQGKGNFCLKDVIDSMPNVQVADVVNGWELLRVMRRTQVDCLPVVNSQNQPIGVIMLEKLLKLLDQVARPQFGESWYEYISGTSAEGVFIIDLDLVLLFVNPKLSEILGYPLTELEGKSLHEILIYSDNCTNQHKEEEKHFRFRAKDGSDIWAIVVTTPLFDGAGCNIGTLGRISNITEKVTEERRRKRKIAALEAAFDGIAILNGRGEFIYTNQAFCHLFAATAAQLIGTTWWKIYGEYKQTVVEGQLQAEGAWQGEHYYNDRYIEISLSQGEDGDLLCICRDVSDRRQIEQAIRESEERYRLLAEYSTDIISRLSPEGLYQYVSPACQLVLGFTPKEMIGRSPFDFIHPEDETRVSLAYRVMIEKLEDHRFLYRHRCKNGSYIWMETGARVKRYSDTQAPTEIIAVSREVTESIEAEEDLMRSQERLKLALEATNDGLWDWNIITGECYFSTRWLSILGYDRGELAPRFSTWDKLLHPEDKSKVLRALADHLGRRTPNYEIEFRMLTKDQTWRWVFTRGKVIARDSTGNAIRMLGAHTDISERKQMEEALCHQYQRAIMLEQITSHIRSSLDIQEVFLNAAQQLSRTFDVSKCIIYVLEDALLVKRAQGDYSGLSCCSLELNIPLFDNLKVDLILHADFPLCSNDVSQETLLSDIFVNERIKSIAAIRTSYQNQPNGLIALFQCDQLRVWRSDEMELLRAVAEQVGIAIAQAQLLQEARAQRQSAETANKTKSEFLAMMSHEIRTPMNGVIGMAELLLYSELASSQKELVETILHSGDALLTILNDILDFSKIESGRLILEQHPFSPQDCFEEVLDLLSALCTEKFIDLIYDIDLSLPITLSSDVTRFRQILMNLLSNAIKFTDIGQIVFQVKTLTPELMLIAIEDTGIGIPIEKMPCLFMPFSQVDPSTTRNYGGTGLGLAISKFLVELMGGQIWLESNRTIYGASPAEWQYHKSQEQGSCFYFTLPINNPEYAEPSLRTLAGKRILVVTPVVSLLAALKRWLQHWGAMTQGMTSLDTARSLLATTSFDGIVCDSQFPHNDLMDLIANNMQVPMILLQSSHSPPFSFVQTITKPIKPGILRSAIEELIATKETAVSHVIASTQVAAETPEIVLKILLVEDNVVNQKVAQRMLMKLGYESDLAANGLEALAALHRQSYDVVLMDIQMPEMDGLTATKKIRQGFAQGPYIIAMTANAMRGDREDCLEAGMNDYLSKPISIATLAEALLKVNIS